MTTGVVDEEVEVIVIQAVVEEAGAIASAAEAAVMRIAGEAGAEAHRRIDLTASLKETVSGVRTVHLVVARMVEDVTTKTRIPDISELRIVRVEVQLRRGTFRFRILFYESLERFCLDTFFQFISPEK